MSLHLQPDPRASALQGSSAATPAAATATAVEAPPPSLLLVSPSSPPPRQVEVTEASVQGQDCLLVALQGDVDVASSPFLERPLREAFVPAGSRPVVLDLRAVTFLDSVGLTILVRFCSLERARHSAQSREARTPGYAYRSPASSADDGSERNDESSDDPLIHTDTNPYRPVILVNRGSQIERILALSQFDHLCQVQYAIDE